MPPSIHLFADERHPRRRRPVQIRPRIDARHPCHAAADQTAHSDVACDRAGKTSQVELGQCGRVRRGDLTGADQPAVLGAKTGRTVRRETVGRRCEQDHVRHGSGLDVAPGCDDDPLRERHPDRSDQPPVHCSLREHHAAGDDDHGRGRSGDTTDGPDRLLAPPDIGHAQTCRCPSRWMRPWATAMRPMPQRTIVLMFDRDRGR